MIYTLVENGDEGFGDIVVLEGPEGINIAKLLEEFSDEFTDEKLGDYSVPEYKGPNISYTSAPITGSICSGSIAISVIASGSVYLLTGLPKIIIQMQLLKNIKTG